MQATMQFSRESIPKGPKWLDALRNRALEKFERQGIPREKDEAWRYTQIDNFNFEKSPAEEVRVVVSSTAGIISADMRKAVGSYPVLEEHMPEAENSDKFDFLNSAFWSNGAFVYAPKNAEGSAEIAISPGISRTVIIAEEGSRLDVVEEIGNTGRPENAEVGGEKLSCNFVDIFAKPGSVVRFYSMQNHPLSVNEFSYKRGYLSKGSAINWNIGQFGGKLSRIKVDNFLVGEGASSDILGVFSGIENQHLDLTTNSFHRATNTTSNILVKGALKDSASQVYRGLIKIDHGAKQTFSYLADHAILLSENAVANSIPSLEIDENDVQCGHAASAGQVDEDKMYYLTTRGLTRKQAESLVVEGFYTPVLAKLPNDKIREKFLDIIRNRLL